VQTFWNADRTGEEGEIEHGSSANENARGEFVD
jgi:hypothetical protein